MVAFWSVRIQRPAGIVVVLEEPSAELRVTGMASGRRVPDLVVPLLLMRKVPPLLTVRLAASSVPADSNIKRPPLTTMAPVKPAPEAPVRLRFPKPLAPLRVMVPDPVKIPA